jgi:hypothetical protein
MIKTFIEALLYYNMSIQLDFGFLKIDIEALIKAIHELTTTQLNDDSKDAIKKVIEQIQNIIDRIVDALSPLYSIVDDNGFTQIFPNQYASFKSTKLKNITELNFSCQVVIEQLNRLRNNRPWITKPFTRDKFAALDSLADMWFTSDKSVFKAMENLQNQLNKKLDTINDSVGTQNTDELREKLKSFLSACESQFKDMESLQIQLGNISAKLV